MLKGVEAPLAPRWTVSTMRYIYCVCFGFLVMFPLFVSSLTLKKADEGDSVSET